jgi:TetR/AcrR family transcriptional regulator
MTRPGPRPAGLRAAPVVLPHIVRSIYGTEPDSEEFLARYSDQLGRMLRALRAR